VGYGMGKSTVEVESKQGELNIVLPHSRQRPTSRKHTRSSFLRRWDARPVMTSIRAHE
jgi:hypothetical protein